MTVLQKIDLEDRPGTTIYLEVLVEDMPLTHNAIGSGDDAEDYKTIQNINDEWDHNNFCWCQLRVVVELENYPQIYGDDYLGGVSILEKFLPEGRTLEEEAIQFAADHDMIGQAMQCLALDMVAAKDSMREFEDANA